MSRTLTPSPISLVSVTPFETLNRLTTISYDLLLMQIKYKRLDLLQHPLVKNYIFHKFWLVTIPIYLAYLLFYCTFLIFLNSFALLSPRPGPESETCKIA